MCELQPDFFEKSYCFALKSNKYLKAKLGLY